MVNTPSEEDSILADIAHAIDARIRLPANMFSDSWRMFYFFEADRVLHESFLTAVASLLAVDHGTRVALVNLDLAEVNGSDASMFNISENTSVIEFKKRLVDGRRGRDGCWLDRRDRYAASSDSGQWCIYVEASEDIGIIAFRSKDDAKAYMETINVLHASTLEDENDSRLDWVPFTIMLSEWKSRLRASFLSESWK